MTEKEKFKILREEEITEDVYNYLYDLFDGLNIEIFGDYKGKLFELMKKGRLEGFCWQTTETAALFMPDDVTIYRGNLYFQKYNFDFKLTLESDYKAYYHGFIGFKYEDKEYIFDPCLGLINSKDLYFNTFNVELKGQTTAKDIKEYFIKYINNPPKSNHYYSIETHKAIERFMKNFYSEEALEKVRSEVIVHDKEDPNAPMYRNGSGYRKVEIEDNKVKSLIVHYYMNA